MTQRVAIGRRLAYFREAASADYWDEVWQRQDTDELYQRAKRGELGYYEEIFPAYLPKDGRIIEAGCGQGQFVMALQVRGYDAEGVDFAGKTVEAVKNRFPDLSIRWGDVTKLDVPDGYYQGYISLGLMEHIKEGPQKFLVEAHRILSANGVALISVPYLNGLRRTKKALGLFRGKEPLDLDFYQYAYSAEEFDEILRAHGFTVVAHHQYGGYKGVKDELPFLSKLFEIPQIGWRLKKLLMHWHWADHHMGHMMMFVCKKQTS